LFTINKHFSSISHLFQPSPFPLFNLKYPKTSLSYFFFNFSFYQILIIIIWKIKIYQQLLPKLDLKIFHSKKLSIHKNHLRKHEHTCPSRKGTHKINTNVLYGHIFCNLSQWEIKIFAVWKIVLPLILGWVETNHVW